ncbi:MAG: nuclear transport factor 2 family protein [Pseudomonadota bacterium]
MTIELKPLLAAGFLATSVFAAGTIAAQIDGDRATLEARTLEWVAGWRTSFDVPFTIEQISHLYAKDDRLFSYDFGRPHDGVEGWEKASRYYEGFMAIPARWTLTPGDDLRVTVRGDVAWTTLSLAGSGEMPNGDPIELPEARVTLIFERHDNDTWLIVHEHGSASIPFPDEETTRALLAPSE